MPWTKQAAAALVVVVVVVVCVQRECVRVYVCVCVCVCVRGVGGCQRLALAGNELISKQATCTSRCNPVTMPQSRAGWGERDVSEPEKE
jgi:hypothetical protein